MEIYAHPEFRDHELVVFFNDPSVSLKGIIAIHNTSRGSALGGCRMWSYGTEEEALRDVLRLSQGMTYKAAMANLKLGGGKAVILGDSKKDKTESLLKAFGRVVEKLNGQYITAEDVGTSVEDMSIIRQETSHVVGLKTSEGGSGDPSAFTAYGVFQSLCAAVFYRLQKKSLKGVRVAVQGLGHVGFNLCRLLHEKEAILFVSDIDQGRVNEAVESFGATGLSVNEVYGADVDVFAPCALGAIINDLTIPLLKARLVVGAANNQLASPRHGLALKEKHILYAPDYIVNAGGLINVSYEGPDYAESDVRQHIERVQDTLLEVFHLAEQKNIPTNDAANFIAEQRFKRPS